MFKHIGVRKTLQLFQTHVLMSGWVTTADLVSGMKKKSTRTASSKLRDAKFLVIYKCGACGQDCGYTELQKPRCRFCGRNDKLVVVSKQEITFEVMVARLKAVTDNMMLNLSQAYEQLPYLEGNIVEEGKDGESELLKLMDKAKKLRDKVHSLKPGKDEDAGQME